MRMARQWKRRSSGQMKTAPSAGLLTRMLARNVGHTISGWTRNRQDVATSNLDDDFMTK
jgi:hypothetical protein